MATHDAAIFVFVAGIMGYHLAQIQAAIRTVSGAFSVCDAQHRPREGTKMTDEDRSEEISSDERRQYDRSRVIVDVSFDGGDATGVAGTKDISMGGLYMSAEADIPVGETLTLRIPLAGKHVVIKGDVVYSNPGHGVGVRFHRLPNDARELMERELPKP